MFGGAKKVVLLYFDLHSSLSFCRQRIRKIVERGHKWDGDGRRSRLTRYKAEDSRTAPPCPSFWPPALAQM